MKNIYKFLMISLIVASSSVFQSCDDNLEIAPNSSLIADTAFRNVADLQSGLNSTYRNYNNIGITLNSIFTDNTKVGIDNGGQQLTLHRLVLDANSGVPGNIWNSRYSIINEATRVIEAAATIDATGSETEVNHILGQAYALRAFAHFELFQYFTPDYSNASGLSVPAVDFVVTVENLPRNTVSEVLAAINGDLTTSASLLDAAQTDNKFITNDFITALRARIAVFSGDFTGALGFANQLIADYPLADTSQYQAMYLDADNTEVIWKAARVVGDAGPGFIWHFGGGGPFMEMSNSLFNVLDPADVRFGVLLNVAASNPANNSHLINRYPGTANQFLADLKLMRVSEMHLIKAEAEIRAGQIDAAKMTLKGLRDARFGADTALPDFNTAANGLTFLLEERRVELAYEGHRYLDLKRFGTGLARIMADCMNLDNGCNIPSNDPRFTLPIPQFELDANDVMVQNPGY